MQIISKNGSSYSSASSLKSKDTINLTQNMLNTEIVTNLLSNPI